jgi:hypothetical protein
MASGLFLLDLPSDVSGSVRAASVLTRDARRFRQIPGNFCARVIEAEAIEISSTVEGVG